MLPYSLSGLKSKTLWHNSQPHLNKWLIPITIPRGPITSIILLSTGRVVLTMWTLGVDVDLCLWEREPSEEGLEVLNVKAWGVEYLCWELGEEKDNSMIDTQASPLVKLFIKILWGKPYLYYDLWQNVPFFQYAPFKNFLLSRCFCVQIFEKEIIYMLGIHVTTPRYKFSF